MIEYTVEKKDQLAALRYSAQYCQKTASNSWLAKSYLIVATVSFGYAVAATIAIYRKWPSIFTSELNWVLGAFGFFLFFCVLHFLEARRAYSKAITNNNGFSPYNCVLDFSEKGLFVSSPYSKSELSWRLFKAVDDISNHIVLVGINDICMFIPKDVFKSKEEEEIFFNEIKSFVQA
jgi:hypothetical protein